MARPRSRDGAADAGWPAHWGLSQPDAAEPLPSQQPARHISSASPPSCAAGKKDFLELTRILTINVADLGQDFFEVIW
jgi:hypothetical protein